MDVKASWLLIIVFRGGSGKSPLRPANQLTPSRTEIKTKWLFWTREKDFIGMGNLSLSNLLSNTRMILIFFLSIIFSFTYCEEGAFRKGPSLSFLLWK